MGKKSLEIIDGLRGRWKKTKIATVKWGNLGAIRRVCLKLVCRRTKLVKNAKFRQKFAEKMQNSKEIPDKMEILWKKCKIINKLVGKGKLCQKKLKKCKVSTKFGL
uniref:Uncharacterized protein n=1 Tax=Romanomermis culicivorax TaxID=13658 RepID=A0A915L3H8_ROMCU